MEFIADVLLIAGATGAAFYCVVLSRRLKKFNDLEKGVGGAIAVMSSQVDDMTKTLALARDTASGSNESLETLTIRAEEVARRLELLVASMHDLPSVAEAPATATSPAKEGQDAASQPPDEAGAPAENESAFRSARNSSDKAAA